MSILLGAAAPCGISLGAHDAPQAGGLSRRKPARGPRPGLASGPLKGYSLERRHPIPPPPGQEGTPLPDAATLIPKIDRRPGVRRRAGTRPGRAAPRLLSHVHPGRKVENHQGEAWNPLVRRLSAGHPLAPSPPDRRRMVPGSRPSGTPDRWSPASTTGTSTISASSSCPPITTGIG